MRVAIWAVIHQSSLASPGGIHRLADALHTAFRVGKGAVLFGEALGRQDHIGLLGRFGQENILHDQKIQPVEGFLGMVEIRVGYHRVFTDNIHRFQGTVVGRRHHLGHFHADLIGHPLNAPGSFHLGLYGRVGHVLIGRVDIGQTAHVAGALDVVLTAQRIDAAAGLPHVAAEHRQIGQGLDIVGAGDVLGDAHAV